MWKLPKRWACLGDTASTAEMQARWKRLFSNVFCVCVHDMFVCDVCVACACMTGACMHVFYCLTSPPMSVNLGVFLPKGFLCGCFNTHLSLLLVEQKSSSFQIPLHAWFDLEPSRKGSLSQWLCYWTRQFAWLEYWPKARGSTLQWRGHDLERLQWKGFRQSPQGAPAEPQTWKLSHTRGTDVTVDKHTHTIWTTGSPCSDANQKGNALWNKLSPRF